MLSAVTSVEWSLKRRSDTHDEEFEDFEEDADLDEDLDDIDEDLDEEVDLEDDDYDDLDDEFDEGSDDEYHPLPGALMNQLNTVNGNNVFSYTQKEEQGGYLAGVAAGLMTKSNIIGMVAGQDYPDIVRTGVGFKRGFCG